MVKSMIKWLILGSIGGASYCLLEILVRGFTHWSMAVVGGVCFLIIGLLNERTPNMPLLKQMFYSMIVVTLVELFAGLVINVWLQLDVWDYSERLWNIWGQICLKNSIYWFFLSVVAVVLDDYIRFWLFGEKIPKYKWK